MKLKNERYIPLKREDWHLGVRIENRRLLSVTAEALENGHFNCPDYVTSIGRAAFKSCANLITSISLPQGLTEIGPWAFTNCNQLTKITLPQQITVIGANAFSGCTKLTEFSFPQSVTKIPLYMFSYCDNLTIITLPQGLTDIEHLFGGHALYFKNDLLIIIEGDDNHKIDQVHALAAAVQNPYEPNQNRQHRVIKKCDYIKWHLNAKSALIDSELVDDVAQLIIKKAYSAGLPFFIMENKLKDERSNAKELEQAPGPSCILS